jgi:hypothetical protein
MGTSFIQSESSSVCPTSEMRNSLLKTLATYDIMPCRLVDSYRRFRDAWCSSLWDSLDVKTEAESF